MTEARSEPQQRPSVRPPVEEPGLSTLEQPEPESFEPNRWLRWLYTRFFRHMRVDERWSGVVRDSAAKGIVIYVMRSISVLDFLCLDYLVKRFRLPLVRFCNDLGLWILEPFGRGGRALRLRQQIPQPEALAKVIHEHQSALLFLRRPPSIGERPTGQGLDVDLIRTLVEQQRKVDLPILVVPQTFVWTQQPANKEPTLIDLLFGPSEWPGRLRVLLRFLFNFRNAQLRSGEAFDIAEFLEEHQDLTDAQAANRIRYALLRRIERERHVVLGPAKKTAGRIREELLRSPRLRTHIEAAAKRQGKPVSAIEKQVEKDLKKLCAMPDPNTVGLFKRLMRWVFTRIYDGFVVDMEGMERVREAARRGPVILLPSHKSHIDYLVLSYVFSENSVSIPLIAAGENLSFWPLGWVLRRSGAFFIRRSFRGSRLYSAIVDAYLRKILFDGWHVELFMEGGRSRTGKLLPPKLGLLSMVVNAGLCLPSRELSFVPISIGYERVIEEGAYTHELAGGEKKPETVGGLLRTGRILRSRYGRLYIQFGEIFELEKLLAEAARLRGKTAGDIRELEPVERRALIKRIAHRVTYEIDRCTIVTPAALVASALMTHPVREMPHGELIDRCAELLAALQRQGARIAHSILRDDSQLVPPPNHEARHEVARELLREDSIEEVLALFTDAKIVETHEADGERWISLPDNRRIALEYHKNAVLHFFVPSALISTVLAQKDEPVDEAELRRRVASLSRLFKYEFMYRADTTFDEIFDDALETMLDAREIERAEESVAVTAGSLVPVYARMLRTYFESYRLAARALDRLPGAGQVKRKDWVKQTLSRGNKLFLGGRIRLRESISKPKLENALSAFHDLGMVRATRETVEAGAALDDDEALGAFERRLARYLE